MAEFTFLEIHLDDASIDGYADGLTALPFSSISVDDEYDRDSGELDTLEGDESPRLPWKAVGLVALLALAAVLAYKRLTSE